MKSVEQTLRERSWAEHERLLALTFMHGSRRRLASALSRIPHDRISFRCETIDSFCLRVVQRFRRNLQLDLPVLPSQTNQWTRTQYAWKATFDSIRRSAAELIRSPIVGKQLRKVYPIVVVDEFQDCSGTLLEVIDALACHSELLIAADEFQLLELGNQSCEAMEWLEKQRQSGNAQVTTLTAPRRTNNPRILNTALALREGKPLASDGIPVIGVDDKYGGLTAYEIAKRIAWDEWNSGSIALITPASPSSSEFIAGILRSLKKPLGKKVSLGPYPFVWESNSSEVLDEIWQAIPSELMQQGIVNIDDLVIETSHHLVVQRAFASAKRLAKLRGALTMDIDELRDIVVRHARTYFVYGGRSSSRRAAMTVHSAKNREFDYVAVVWPYEVKGDHVYQRKLLYNAVTRAKKEAVVFVRGKSRLVKDPVLKLIST